MRRMFDSEDRGKGFSELAILVPHSSTSNSTMTYEGVSIEATTLKSLPSARMRLMMTMGGRTVSEMARLKTEGMRK